MAYGMAHHGWRLDVVQGTAKGKTNRRTGGRYDYSVFHVVFLRDMFARSVRAALIDKTA